MSAPKLVRVVTRPRTMSGRRGGLTLTLPPDVAREWIARGWADPEQVDEPVAETRATKPVRTGAMASPSKVGAILLALALLAAPAFGAAYRQEMVASAAQTASGNSPAFSISTATNLFVGVDVTACSGTAVLTVFLQGSDDGGTTWYDIPADAVIESANTAAQGAQAALGSTTSTRDIVDTLTCGSTLHIVPYLGIYRNLATDRVRLKWIISSTTSATFSASYVAK